MIKPPWYEPVEKKLRPFTISVILALLVIVGITIYIIAKGNNISRTGWLVYLLMP